MSMRAIRRAVVARFLLGIALVLSGCGPAQAPLATPTAAAVPTAIANSPSPTSAPAGSAAGPTSPPPSVAGTATPTAGATTAAGPTATNPTTTSSPPAAAPAATTSGQAASAAPPSGGDWPTYHRDNTHSGVDPTLAAFAQMREAWRSGPLDGDVYAEPLVVRGQVIVATQNDSVYSLDLATGRPTWRAHLGEPIARSTLPCGNISTTGITSTPVADAGRGVVYAVTFVQPGRHELVALDLASGGVRFRAPIDPAGADPLTHQQRAALVLSQGTVYVAFGGLFGDCGAYHGWVVAADPANGSARATYQVPTQREGAIWAPPGPSIDAAGNLFVATGNGSSTDSSHFDYGNAVLRLSPALKLLDWFAPTNWAQLSAADADIGSLSPALLNDGLVFQIGKAGVGYLLRADHLGQIGGQIFQANVCRAGFGGTAYRAPMLYVPCADGLVALRIANNAFATAWRAPGFFAGPPIVAGGAVWTIGRDGTLFAFDPGDGNTRTRSPTGTVNHFATPSASGPYLVVPAAREIIAERLE